MENEKSLPDEDICKVPSITSILSRNFNIPDEILNAYYGLALQPKTKGDAPDYYGKLERYNNPFKTTVYGAFVLSVEFDIILMKSRKAREGDKHYEHFGDEYLWPAFKEYAKGFQYGFDNFLNEKVNTKSALSNTEDFKAQKIIDYLSSIALHRPCFSEVAVSDNVKTKQLNCVLGNWYNDGIEAGYLYSAWYLILENYKLFEPFFKELKPIDFNNEKPAVASFALMHVFWGKVDDGKNITKTNCKHWAEKYGISYNTLLFHFSAQVDKSGRQPNQKSIDDSRYLKPFFKRFEDALKMLKPLSEDAFKLGEKELNLLENMYKDGLT